MVAKTKKTVTKKTEITKIVEEYSGKEIKELPFPVSVQKRMSLYLGTSDERAMNHGVQEILNNSVDEFLAGFCTHIRITRLSELSFSIKDNGRGVPFDTQPDGTPTLKKIFGSLHAGRNFKEDDAKTDYSTGLNGVGASAVNALSASFEVISRRGKDQGSIHFENGYEKEVNHAKRIKQKEPFLNSSTEVKFTYNSEFFEEGSIPVEENIVRLIRETAYLNTGLSITYINLDDKEEEYSFPDGIKQLLKERIEEADRGVAEQDEGILFEPIYFPSEVVNKTKIEIAFTYRNNFKGENITSFCNTINTALGGTAVTGFKRALSMRLTAYIRDRGLVKEKFSNEDVFVGLEAIVSVFVFHPKFSDQLKQKLDNREVNGHVYSYALQHLEWWLSTDPKEMKVLAAKIQLSAKARIAQKRAIENIKKDNTGSLIQSMNNPDKFIDCISKSREGTELFLVEG